MRCLQLNIYFPWCTWVVTAVLCQTCIWEVPTFNLGQGSPVSTVLWFYSVTLGKFQVSTLKQIMAVSSHTPIIHHSHNCSTTSYWTLKEPQQAARTASQYSNQATGWMNGCSWFDSQQGLGIFLLDPIPIPALGPTQPPIQWVLGAKAARAWSWSLTSI